MITITTTMTIIITTIALTTATTTYWPTANALHMHHSSLRVGTRRSTPTRALLTTTTTWASPCGSCPHWTRHQHDYYHHHHHHHHRPHNPPPLFSRQLPPGWYSAVDPNSGATYYYNDLGQSMWELPPLDPEPEPQPIVTPVRAPGLVWMICQDLLLVEVGGIGG
jgi:hypothetical protein